MMLHVPEVLSGELLTQLRTELRATLSTSEWLDGTATSGQQASMRKQNRQLTAGSAAGKKLGAMVSAALEQHPLFVSAALPQYVLPPLFNCYEGGGHYGNHVDSAIQRDAARQAKVRTDISITVFISDPDEYDGGELIIEDTYGMHEVKLQAGDAILYPSTSLHRVEPVTRGMRLAAVTWVQSMVRDDWQRAMLFNLDMTIMQLRQQLGDTTEVVALTSHYHNLLRQWADL
ncbi:MAG: Fe2+-dependent dioxygenase [Pseudomonadota bacterium]